MIKIADNVCRNLPVFTWIYSKFLFLQEKKTPNRKTLTSVFHKDKQQTLTTPEVKWTFLESMGEKKGPEKKHYIHQVSQLHCGP